MASGTRLWDSEGPDETFIAVISAVAVRCHARVHAEVEHLSCFLCQRLSFVRRRFFRAAPLAAGKMQPGITIKAEKTTNIAGRRWVLQNVCVRQASWSGLAMRVTAMPGEVVA
jgi:hypothetical protein